MSSADKEVKIEATSSADKDYDVCVFGASGFTGKRVCWYLLQTYGASVSLLFAGRQKAKLQKVLDECENLADEFKGSVELLEADVEDQESLDRMAAKARVLINCVGPFRFYGQQVIDACVRNGCHYVDITGEPEFIERSMTEYDEAAKANRVTVVNCCGFDSVPSDMGVIFIKQQLEKEWLTPGSVEMFLRVLTGKYGMRANYGTYQTAIWSIAQASELRKFRSHKESKANTDWKPVGPKLKINFWPHWEPMVKRWVLPFMFADPTVVRISQRLLQSSSEEGIDAARKPVYFGAYVEMPSFIAMLATVVMVMIVSFLALVPFTRDLLLKYPEFFTLGLFSRRGPDQRQIDTCSFQSNFYVTAYTETGELKKFKARVSGGEIGYRTTAICVAEAAMTVLNESGVIPHGVMTPAAAFARTTYIDSLNTHEVKFEWLA